MGDSSGYTNPGIAGSGTIACGLAACASQVGAVHLLARSDASAWRAEEEAQAQARKLEDGVLERIKVTTQVADLSACDLVVEAIVEDAEAKAALLSELGAACPGADLASTTSSLSLAALGRDGGVAGRLLGLHVFNPVAKMELIELCLPDGLHEGVAGRARDWCRALGKTAVEVPDQTGFVVNRLLFPFLFDAVRTLENTSLTPAEVDACMRLGANHPMGPLKLLDLVGLDVAEAIGDSLHEATGDPSHEVPERLRELVAAGKLGRKLGSGFYDYD